MSEATGAVAATESTADSANNLPPTEQGSGGAALESTGFRWGDNAPEDWRGRDAEYAVNQYNTLVNAVRQYVSEQANQTPMYQPQQPIQIDPDEVVTNPAAWQEKLQANLAQSIAAQQAQALAPILQSTTEAARHLSRTDPSLKQVWDKWGNEVEQMAAGLPPQARTNKQVWDGLAKIVKANHVDELAQERAQQLATELRATATEGGYGSVPGSIGSASGSGFDKLEETKYGKEVLDKYGPDKVRRMCEARGITVEKFAEECAGTNIIRNPNNPSEWTNRDLVRDR